MPSHEEKKKAIAAYKERKEIGGLYRVVNEKHGWQSPVAATPNMQGQKNKLQFAKKTNTRFDSMLEGVWEQYGPDGFEFVELELLEKKPELTAKEFREELEALREMWMEGEGR